VLSVGLDRDRGTLRLALASGGDPRRMLRAKAVALALAIGLPAAALLMVFGSICRAYVDASAPWSRVIMLAIGYLLYLGLWLFAGLAIASRVQRSDHAIAFALIAWFVVALLLPRAGGELAKALHPLPSRAAFNETLLRQIEKGIDGHNPHDARRKALEGELLRKYGVSKKEDLPINFDGVALDAGEQWSNEVYDKNYAELWASVRQQNALRLVTSLASPSAAMGTLSMALAGSDSPHLQHFAAAAEHYRRGFVSQMNSYVTHQLRPNDWNKTAGPEVWASVSPFGYTLPGAAFALDHAKGALLVLVVWAALIALLTAHFAKGFRP
jgi:ABC-2 type transport system permease protein